MDVRKKHAGIVVLAGLGIVCVVWVGVIAVGLLSDPLGFRSHGAPVVIPEALTTSDPIPYDDSGRWRGYAWADAQSLARDNELNGRQTLTRERLVSADEPSNSPNVVSVRPLSDVEWLAVSLNYSNQCIAMRVEASATGDVESDRRFGIVTPTEPCQADRVSPETVDKRDL